MLESHERMFGLKRRDPEDAKETRHCGRLRLAGTILVARLTGVASATLAPQWVQGKLTYIPAWRVKTRLDFDFTPSLASDQKFDQHSPCPFAEETSTL